AVGYVPATVRPGPARQERSVLARFWIRRNAYLAGAVCLVLCAFALTPIVFTVAASVKSAPEAAAVPPTYFPSGISPQSYVRLWNSELGLPTYLLNSFGTAMFTIAFALLLTVPAAYALARFPLPYKEVLFVFLLLALIIPYQALLTPVFLMFSQLRLT